MSYRPLNNELRNSLYNNDPYIIAHLIKFERPGIDTSYLGQSSEESTIYSYLTDAHVDLEFDDGSYSRVQQRVKEAYELNDGGLAPTPNGPQTYRANKVLSVGTINEGVEAKASSLSLTLDATALGINVMATCAFPDDFTITTDIDLSEEGFSEGDKIQFNGSSSDNDGSVYVINRFTSGGTTIKATLVAGSHVTQTSASLYNVALITEEISAFILGDGNVSYTNYINREVSIYRLHINPETNAVIGGTGAHTSGGYTRGGAMLLFKGIIAGANLLEDPKTGTKMTWSLTSHWGDFVRVQNRITQDDSHRALDERGAPDLNAVVRKEYASDLGFAHSELALNLTAKYNKKETEYKLEEDTNFIGIHSYTLVQDEVDVPSSVDLKLNLKAKALPVVYGVRKIDSIPFFFDNLKNQSKQVYVGYALCEGTIGGVLDIIIDDQSTICVDVNDAASRSAQNTEDSVDIVCQGRQDRGQTLVGTPSSEGTGIVTESVYIEGSYDGGEEQLNQIIENHLANGGSPAVAEPYFTTITRALPAGGVGYKGIQHEEAYRFRTPIDCTLTFHKGTPSQAASNLFVEKADKGLFKIQNDYFDGNPASYWTKNHRVLDTAYFTAEFLIDDGDTTIPQLDFIVRGRDVNCHNYDGSYSHSPAPAHASQSPANFDAGNTVWLSGTGITSYATTIIDKWSFIDGDGVTQDRFRWQTPPVPTSGDLKMSVINTGGDGPGSTHWNMQVSSVVSAQGSPEIVLSAGLSSSQNVGGISLINPTSALEVALAATYTYTGTGESLTRSRATFGLYNTANIVDATRGSVFTFGSYSSDELLAVPYLAGQTLSVTNVNNLILRNAINLDDALASGGSDQYIGSTIKLVRYGLGGIPYEQERKIVQWTVSNSKVVAFVDSPWDVGYEPSTSDFYTVITPPDLRVSINPAMQLLDYLTNKRYGKGLKDTDIDLPTFKGAAEQCDTRSDVTVVVTQSNIQLGDVYRRQLSGQKEVWRGTVKSFESITISGVTYRLVTFKDCIGKLVSKWNDYTTYFGGQLVWNSSISGVTLRSKSSEGTMETPTSASNNVTSFNINKVSGNGSNTLTLDCGTAGYSGDGNPVIKNKDRAGGVTASGYSLYDSDNIKYWKYLGWDSPAQRNVTRHQLNTTVNTSNTIFANINNMLRQFNGILRYANGQYQLNVKSAAPVLTQYEKIDETDIIGSVKITDKGSKKTYNSVSASIKDPQNNFEARSVNFFNSDYLKQDLGIPKKGTFATPSITNYYNARFGIKQFMDESRNGLEAQFTIRPSGLLLQSGEVIALSYSSFGWVEKLWRVSNLNFMPDGTVSVTAYEHDNTAYEVGASEVLQGTANKESGPGTIISSTPDSPNGLQTQGGAGGIRLLWVQGLGWSAATHDVQVFSNTINVRTQTVPANGAGTDSSTLILDSVANIAAGMTVAGKLSEETISKDNRTYSNILVYSITRLGDTDWNTLNNTSNVNYQVGDTIKPTAVGSFTTTETGRMIAQSKPVKVLSVDSNTNTVTLTQPMTWVNDEAITFKASMVAGRIDADEWTDQVLNENDLTVRYYWIRYAVKRNPTANIAGLSNKIVFSKFHPDTVQGIAGTAANVNLIRDLGLTTDHGSQFVYEDTGRAIDTGRDDNTTITASGINGIGTETYKFEQYDPTANSGAGAFTTVRSFAAGNTYTFNAPEDANSSAQAFGKFPITIRVTFRDIYNGITHTASKEITLTAARIVLDGTDGGPGNAARGVSLTAGQHSFPYSEGGSVVGGNTTTLTATPTNQSSTASNVFYDFKVDGTSIQNTNSLTATYTAEAAFGDMPQKVSVDLREGNNSGAVLASDAFTMVGLKQGAGSLTMILTNPTHAIPVNFAGNGTMDNSGTTVRVFEGATELAYTPGSTQNAGQWKISGTSDDNITVSSTATDNGNSVTFGEAINLGTDNTAEITFTASGKRLDGTPFSNLSQIQTFAKAVPGNASRGVSLTLPQYAFAYDSSGAESPTSTYTVTAVATNTVGTPYYDFDVISSDVGNTVTNISNGTSSTMTYNPPNSFDDMPQTIRVRLREGSASGDVLSEDRVSVYGVQQGASAIVTVLTNESHGISVSQSNTPDLTGSGTTIKVFEGVTQLDYQPTGTLLPGHWRISSTSDTNITIGSLTESGDNLVVGDHTNPTASQMSVTYNITGLRLDGTTFTDSKIQSLTKAVVGPSGSPGTAGDSGASISATNLAMRVFADSAGNVAATNRFTSVITVVVAGVEYTYDGIAAYANNSWHFGTITDSNGNSYLDANEAVVSNLGVLTLSDNNAFYSNTATSLEFDAEIQDDNNTTLGILRYQFVKELGIRAPARIVTTLANNNTPTLIQETNARDWCGSGHATVGAALLENTGLSTAASTNVMKDAVSKAPQEAAFSNERFLRPGDIVEVGTDGDNAIDKGHYIGQRIYMGDVISKTTIDSSTSSGQTPYGESRWSGIIVERVDGSMVVHGTLQAETLRAGSTFTNNLEVQSNFILGTTDAGSSTSGKFYSTGKTGFSNNTAGFFLGFEVGSSDPKFAIGDSSEFLKFDSSSGGNGLEIQTVGGFSLKSTSSGSRLEIVNSTIKIFSGSESTPRVQIGNLS